MYVDEIKAIYQDKVLELKHIPNLVEREIGTFDKDKLLELAKHRIDCTVWNTERTFRLRQTIDFTYKANMYEAVLLGENLIDDAAERYKYFKDLYDIHTANLSYEQCYPPVIYDPIKSAKKSSTSKSKTSKKTSKSNEASKDTAAKRKLAQKVLKLNNLVLKLK